MVNENNYKQAVVTVVGLAGGPWSVKEFDGGGSQAELSVAVGQGYRSKQTGEWVDKGTVWYRVTATPDYAANNWPDDIDKGDTVRVDNAKQELRAYQKQDGSLEVGTTLSYAEGITVLQKKEQAEPAYANGF
jgi:single-stranded DNA-binding protein